MQGPVFVPIFALFGSLLWIMVFIENYRHFPKMGQKERLWMSLSNATLIALGVVMFAYLTLMALGLA